MKPPREKWRSRLWTRGQDVGLQEELLRDETVDFGVMNGFVVSSYDNLENQTTVSNKLGGEGNLTSFQHELMRNHIQNLFHVDRLECSSIEATDVLALCLLIPARQNRRAFPRT